MTLTSSDGDVRTIDTGAPPARYARGWHCLGLAETFRDGAPHAVQVFGTKLVVFADSAGALHVLDGYCRHMGGDLTQGTIKGDEVACPFHDWRWGGNGRCVSIPYARRVPPRARTRTWLTLERNEQLFVYNDPEGNPPPPGVEIPSILSPSERDQWSAWTWDSILVEGANCREIIDNVVDMAHFFYIHHAFPVFFKNVFEGHVASQYLHSRARADTGLGAGSDPGDLLKSEASYYGPSYMIDYLTNEMANGFSLDTILINCHYPVTPTSFRLQWGLMVKNIPGVDEVTSNKIARKLTKSYGVGFLQDVEIWRNKTPMDNPLLCEEDGPVYQLRRWYEQFYVDAADVTGDMVARFEFEVDTTRAVETWEAEVAENLARTGDS
ncbi:Rieske 2Fe-2S domain-containing protein [Cryptosporangium phraense]|uniref:Rieske-type oxygenase n=1 Tax=Cryptosporangium phraense TaxID=2593070 RepID=A0A545B0H0_9ACTN|nr:Rieske 2Fe-2S domain-containing protein [Cryptosporangium phraense]TQS47083.1 3-ketosteroid-9-alpha-hydroxylase subunit A [Cryptosporangium phraense]